MLKNRDCIISLVRRRNPRYLKKTHKFGIEVPTPVDEVLELDKENGDTHWSDVISSDINNVKVAFDVLPDGHNEPIGHQFLKCHVLFDVKIEYFRRKSRYVAGGHITNAPPMITYASVVSCETVRLALTIAALNSFQVKAAEIMNTYVTDPITENIWTVLYPEFGADARKKEIIFRALYGLKSSGASFRNHLVDFMRHMGYKSCMADTDLWLKPELRPSDRF